MKQIVLTALSVVLAALSARYALTTNYNFGNFLVWAAAVVCVVYTIFWRRLDPWLLGTLPGKLLLGLAGVGCALFAVVLGVILFGQVSAKPTGKEKALIVLGCAVHGETPSAVLVCRLQAALEYHHQNPDAWLVVCGGQGPGEEIPEAEAMRRWLAARGVPEELILCEDKSTSTQENFRFALALLAEKGIGPEAPLAYTTNGFHCYRAGRYAAGEGYTDLAALPATLPPIQILPCYAREVFALVYYWVFKSPHTGLMGKLVGLVSVLPRPALFR